MFCAKNHKSLFVTTVVLTFLEFAQNVPIQDKNYWNKDGQDELERLLKQTNRQNVAKNIILFLGDGMSLATITAARIFEGQLRKESGEENYLSWERFAHTGLLKTYATNSQVSDSANTATAILSGIKSKRATLGVDDNIVVKDCSTVEKAKVDSIFQWALREKKQVGIVTTMRVTHASPAAAYAHVPYRGMEFDGEMISSRLKNLSLCSDITTQLLENAGDFKVILGGGYSNFFPLYQKSKTCGQRSFKGRRVAYKDLSEEWKTKQESKGRKPKVICTREDLQTVKEDEHVLGLFSDDHMLYADQRETEKHNEPTIVEMTEKAIQLLRNPNGFFLMVEGGKIDHGNHGNHAYRALIETEWMSRAVEKAMTMVSIDDTLLVVTSDHSHALMFHSYPSKGNPILGKVRWEGKLSLAKDGKPLTSLMYASGPESQFFAKYNGTREDITNIDTTNPAYGQQAMIPTSSAMHSGDDVIIYSVGPMSHLFSGVHEQSYVAHAMAYASCVGRNKKHCNRASTNQVSNSTLVLSLALFVSGYLLEIIK